MKSLGPNESQSEEKPNKQSVVMESKGFLGLILCFCSTMLAQTDSLEEQGKADLQVLAIIFDKPLAERWKTGTGNSVHYKKRQEKKPRNHRPVSLYFSPRKTLEWASEQIITPGKYWGHE